mmetsp:Transcript_48073/g.72703  ORF Transcript_48073/g.72703 Transcript_48073/m.72703 type:complete len:161 (-) Transcript_48073:474-956(-)
MKKKDANHANTSCISFSLYMLSHDDYIYILHNCFSLVCVQTINTKTHALSPPPHTHPKKSHFVTTVSPRAQGKGKRLAYNGWWHSSWVPKTTDPLETLLDTPEKRLTLTHAQVCAIQDMLDDPWAPRIQPPERHEEIVALRGKIMEELYPVRRSPPVDVL